MQKQRKISLLFILIITLLFADINISQTQLDSLKNLLPESAGKEKIKILVKIGFFLSSENPTESIKYLDEAIEL